MESLQLDFAFICANILAARTRKDVKQVHRFDHSSGHSKQRSDGLSTASANLGFGGKESMMRDTTISDAATELGGCVERVLNVGDV